MAGITKHVLLGPPSPASSVRGPQFAMFRSAVKTPSIFPKPGTWQRLPGVVLMSTTLAPSLAEPPVLAHSITKPIYLSLTQPLTRRASVPVLKDNVVVLDPAVFDHPIRRDILHLCVTHYLDSLRQGTASTKTRGEVRGSGAKIRPQKGSGKARLGDAQSPMLVGGGVAFGPKPRDFSTKLPRKVIQMGMRVALSAKIKERELGVTMNLDWPNGKTKHLARMIDLLGLQKTLFVTGEEKPCVGLEKAIANIPRVKLVTVEDLNVYEILKWQKLLLDVKAVEYFERVLGKHLVV